MGKLVITAKYIFLIYGSDINEVRKHIHVTNSRRGHKSSCKFWLEPRIELDNNKKGEFTNIEINEILKLISENQALIKEQLKKFYSLDKVKAIVL